jgi:hypothetical protein
MRVADKHATPPPRNLIYSMPRSALALMKYTSLRHILSLLAGKFVELPSIRAVLIK